MTENERLERVRIRAERLAVSRRVEDREIAEDLFAILDGNEEEE